MIPRPLTTVITVALLTGASPLRAAVDRHPEARSRAVAWTEFDGAYWVDPNNRTEMLDFYRSVFAAPYPSVTWTGSLQNRIAGETSELWRVREYAQLNAYRALNMSPVMEEDGAKLSFVQEGALVLALNPTRPVSHTIDASWIGYNETAAQALADSSLGGFTEGPITLPNNGVADGLILDPGASNAAQVGHRAFILHDGNVHGTVGAAEAAPGNFRSVWNSPVIERDTPIANFVAWPAPGYEPLPLFQYAGTAFRWSFVLSTDSENGDSLVQANVTAKVNGVAAPVKDPVNNIGITPLTWEFDPSVLDLTKAADGTRVEITVTNVLIFGVPYSYTYTVTFFDPTKIVPVAPAPAGAILSVSAQGRAGVSDQSLTGTFVVTGTLPVRVAVRSKISSPIQRPHLQLFDATGHLLGENSAWRAHPNVALLQGFGVAPTNDADAAMVMTLWPGTYIVQLADDATANAGAQLEAFDIDNLASSRLTDLGVRAAIAPGQNLSATVSVQGDTGKTYVFRTLGAGLAQRGVASPAKKISVSVLDSTQNTIATYSAVRADDAAALAAWGLLPSSSDDIAGLVTLPPGASTFVVSANSAGDAGVAYLEVYSAQSGTPVMLTTTAAAGASVQWQKNGANIAGATSTTLALASVQPDSPGIYSASVSQLGVTTVERHIVGLFSAENFVGDASDAGHNIQHPNGNVFDQVLLQGTAATIAADAGQITRLSYVDPDDDIVQVEFAGAGTLSLVLENPSGPAAPVNYNQPGVSYMKGRAGIVITGANENTYVSIFSVGRLTAVNQALFRDNVTYGGVADIAFLAISSANGQFGAVRTGNTRFSGDAGFIGLYAPGVSFKSLVYLGNIAASGTAHPVLILGGSPDTRITGGDLFQPNGSPVEVAGFSAASPIRFTAGTDSHGNLLSARANRGTLLQNGAVVTSQIVVNP